MTGDFENQQGIADEVWELENFGTLPSSRKNLHEEADEGFKKLRTYPLLSL